MICFFSHFLITQMNPLIYEPTDTLLTSSSNQVIELQSHTCEICNHNIDVNAYTRHLLLAHGDILEKAKMVTLHPVVTEPTQLVCVICNKVLSNKEHLRNHTIRHLPKDARPKITCSSCGECYDNNWEFSNHFKAVHVEENLSSILHDKSSAETPHCVDEPSIPSNKQPIEIKNTLPSRITLPSYTCKICSHVEYGFYLYCHHLKSTHSDVLRNIKIQTLRTIKMESSQFICPICNTAYKTITTLKSHVRQHLPRNLTHKYVCKECGKRYGSIGEFHNHLKTAHSEQRPLSCDLCDKTFKVEPRLKRHMATHNKAYKCEGCGKKYACERSLEVHRFRCIPDKEGINCKVCNTNYCDLQELNRHVRLTHGVDGEFKCKTCSEVFNTPYSLKLHKRDVHSINREEESPHICNICNKSFALSGALKAHLRVVHRNKTNYVCEVCGKEVTTKSSLRDHKLIHAGIKPFQCHDCGKAFVSKTVLKVHCASHKGLKKHTCTTCLGKFSQRTALVIHMRSHTGEKPYKCDLCDKAFVTKTIMNTHKKKKHKVAH